MAAAVVTVTLPTGTKVTCSKETADKLGYSASVAKASPAKPPATRKKSAE